MDCDLEQTVVVTFQYLEDCLSRATAISPVDNPRELLRLLPECSSSAQRLILAELVKFDMVKGGESGCLRRLDFYDVILQPMYPQGSIPLDLVLEEIQVVRRFAGQEPQLAELQSRFPHLTDVLQECLVKPQALRDARVLEQPPDFAAGETVDDFAIVRTLGHGSFARVYLARQLTMQRLVALKVSQLNSDEPITLSQLDHPNVVRVFDHRRIAEPNCLLLYMQYVSGGTIADVIKETRDLPIESLSGANLLRCIDSAMLVADQHPPEHSATRDALSKLDWAGVVAWLGVQLAEGLAAAHERGIMHRDVKPANILLSPDGVPKLADFNVSYGNIEGCAGASVHFGGSLPYMSPEQLQVANPVGGMRADELDCRADLYSLGMVLWELWQGRRPVPMTELVEGWHQAIMQQLRMRRTAPKLNRSAISAAGRVLEKTLRSVLSFESDQRPQCGKEMAGRLRLALHANASEYFEPATTSWRGRVLKLPVLLVAGFIIFIPNGLAGALNYQYNYRSIEADFPHLLPWFVKLSVWVNCIAFPIGAVLLVVLIRPLQVALRRRHQNVAASESSVRSAWQLGHLAAMIGGVLWLICGVVFPIGLRAVEPEFGVSQSIEFFLSLAICGGIAWIYPFFGISLVSITTYYTALISRTMVDTSVHARVDRLKRRATNYLVTAAAIPLAALGLLAIGPRSGPIATGFLLVAVTLTSIALPFAFLAHQRLSKAGDELLAVLDDGGHS